MRLHLLVLDGVFDLGLAALTDTLSTASSFAVLSVSVSAARPRSNTPSSTSR